jgi:pyruvate/2-oxoglutarate dehydrogenase complex dihydrolipoamide dehydrogenase (E3) component
MEFARMHRRFGAPAVVEMGRSSLASRTRRGGVAVKVDCESGDRKVVGSDMLFAVDRRPNTDDLDLERAGIPTNAMG